MKLTSSYLQTLRPRDVKYTSRSERGLHVVVYPSGARTWRFRYFLDGRARHIRLGEFPALRLDDARLAAMRLRDRVRIGMDPLAERAEEQREQVRERAARITFEELVTAYYSDTTPEGGGHQKSARANEQTVRRRFVKFWGALPPEAITRPMVRAALQRIVAEGEGAGDNHAARNRALRNVRPVFAYAVNVLEILTKNPAAKVRELEQGEGDRVLDGAELRWFWHALEGSPIRPPVQAALRVLLLTGQRPSEVGGLDMRSVEGDWWTIADTKNEVPQRVFLAPTTRGIIDAALAASPSDRYPFANAAGKPVDAKVLGDELRAWRTRETLKGARFAGGADFEAEPFTPHDLRRTVGTGLGRLGFDRFAQDRVLNHKDRGVASIYDRHTYDELKRRAWEAWDAELLSIVGA